MRAHLGLRVLVVDDSTAVRERLVELLASVAGVADVWQADGVAAASSMLAQRQPDLIVLDFRMRDGSGVDLLRRIRSAGPTPVVVMLTGYPLEPYRVRCLAAGADYFLDKSSEVDRLVEIVASLARDLGERS